MLCIKHAHRRTTRLQLTTVTYIANAINKCYYLVQYNQKHYFYMNLKTYLEDLENRIDTVTEDQLKEEWKIFASGNFTGDIFSPARPEKSQPQCEWPEIKINQTLQDYDAMLLHQLKGCSDVLSNGSGRLLSVRCNYGTSILPSLFGVEPFIMDEELNTLPTSRALEGGRNAMIQIVQDGVPPLSNGYWPQVKEMALYFKETLAPYPNISKYITIYHPDLQGPLDCTELLWGSDIFLAFVDEPELVHSVLQRIVDTYIAMMKEWETIVPPEKKFAVHWTEYHRGRIMIRNDSAMNLSPDMCDTFIRPYDQQLLDAHKGGAIHFCGRGDHYIAMFGNMPGVFAVNLTQPHYNDMEKIFTHTIDKGIQLIGLSADAGKAALDSGRDLHGNVHCYLQ